MLGIWLVILYNEVSLSVYTVYTGWIVDTLSKALGDITITFVFLMYCILNIYICILAIVATMLSLVYRD